MVTSNENKENNRLWFLDMKHGLGINLVSLCLCVFVSLCLWFEGMHLNNHLLQLIGLRFADGNYDIDFDDYLTCIVRLENMFSTLQAPHLNTTSGFTVTTEGLRRIVVTFHSLTETL